MVEREKLSFWVRRELADQVRQTLLDHKKATRKRVTISEGLFSCPFMGAPVFARLPGDDSGCRKRCHVFHARRFIL